jgi:hypothetical protein
MEDTQDRSPEARGRPAAAVSEPPGRDEARLGSGADLRPVQVGLEELELRPTGLVQNGIVPRINAGLLGLGHSVHIRRGRRFLRNAGEQPAIWLLPCGVRGECARVAGRNRIAGFTLTPVLVQMVRRYIHDAELFHDNAAAKLGL